MNYDNTTASKELNELEKFKVRLAGYRLTRQEADDLIEAIEFRTRSSKPTQDEAAMSQEFGQLESRIFLIIADAVSRATHNTPEAKVGLTDWLHARGANNHPAYLAVLEHLGPLVNRTKSSTK